jgi:hypothetical protein
MPRKESSGLDERLRFLARVLDGEPMTEVCRDFGISRKTGYKVFDRYKEPLRLFPVAYADRSIRQSVAGPARGAHRPPHQIINFSGVERYGL